MFRRCLAHFPRATPSRYGAHKRTSSFHETVSLLHKVHQLEVEMHMRVSTTLANHDHVCQTYIVLPPLRRHIYTCPATIAVEAASTTRTVTSALAASVANSTMSEDDDGAWLRQVACI